VAAISFEIASYRAIVGPELRDLEQVLGLRLAAVIQCKGKDGGLTLAAIRAGEAVPGNLVGHANQAVLFVAEVQYPWYLDLLRNEAPVVCTLDPADPETISLHCDVEEVGEGEAALAAVPPGPPPDLDAWLDANPVVRDAVIWDGHSWVGWPDDNRAQLRESFAAAWRHEAYREIADPPPNQVLSNPLNVALRQVLSREDAWRLYVGYAGHSLALEIGRRLPWSIAAWPASRLRLLLSGEDMFRPVLEGMEIADGMGSQTPCGVRRSWRFLVEEGLLRATALATVGRLLEWSRDLLHVGGGLSGWAEKEAFWHYRGFPPISRVIEGTDSPHGFGHHIDGCWGELGLLKTVLRAANIPVQLNVVVTDIGAHALPGFPSIDRFLTHGDDPYSRGPKSALPFFAGEDLLINGARFAQLFNDSRSPEENRLNIGRRPVELALDHTCTELLVSRCRDRAAGRDDASGEVFDIMRALGLSVEALRDRGFYARLDAEIEAFGGCDHVPPTP
jgi:hypothetical protein